MPTAGPVAGLALAVAVAVVLGGCSSAGSEGDDVGESLDGASAAAPASVPLEVAEVPAGLRIGVVVSLASKTDSGSQWRAAAEGAQVAAHRFRLAGDDVAVVAADDKGTSAGAAAAVQQLVGEGVSGVVLATSGAHVKGALDAARVADVPILLPYAPDPNLPDNGDAWLTGPDRTSITGALNTALDDAGLTAPVLVDAGGSARPGVTTIDQLTFRSGPAGDRVARQVARLGAAGEADSVLVVGAAAQQAQAVSALQGAGAGLPLVLTPDAVSPAFAEALAAAGGSLAVDIVSVGEPAGDPAALEPGPQGEALSAFFAALRDAATDDDLEDFFDGGPFAAVADTADIRSHDAVVALVLAAVAAGSTDPAAVGNALAGLEVGAAEGLAGGALDFSRRSALAPEAVVPLQATAQDPGVRPSGTDGGEPEPQLFWFAVPSP